MEGIMSSYWSRRDPFSVIFKIQKVVFTVILFTAGDVFALSATSAQYIQGSPPRFSPQLEGDIQNGYDFPLLGINFQGVNYYSQADLKPALASIVATKNTPASLGLSVAYDTVTESQAMDINGDEVSGFTEQFPGSVKINWFYKNGLVETLLSESQKELSFCDLEIAGIKPYAKVSGPIALQTEYGVPRTQNYPDSELLITSNPVNTFYFDINDFPAICFAQPSLFDRTGSSDSQLPKVWNPKAGFLAQSSTNYGLNFPTTGANGLFFDLIILGFDAQTLTWPTTVTVNNITASITVIDSKTVRVTLLGPSATPAQILAVIPTPAPAFIKGTEIEIVARDSSNNPVMKYGFNLTKWFINRGSQPTSATELDVWCQGLGNAGTNYITPSINSVTNSNSPSWWPGTSWGNLALRVIGDGDTPHPNTNLMTGGILSEWGSLSEYTVFTDGMYYTINSTSSGARLRISSDSGAMHANLDFYPSQRLLGMCQSIP